MLKTSICGRSAGKGIDSSIIDLVFVGEVNKPI